MTDIRNAGPRLRQMNDVLDENERLLGRLAWTERERGSLRRSIKNLAAYVAELNAESESLRSSVHPQPYAKSDEKRVDPNTKRDTTQPRNGALSGCETVRSESEPVAWALMRHGKAEQVATHPVYLCGDIHRVAPLYAHQTPMLTAAERDAIQTAMNAYGSDNANPECAAIEATLWGLLERLK